MAKEKREHHSYRRGGRPKSDKPSKGAADAPAPNKSWEPGNEGQGGEGLSKGYGGSAGAGTGPSGPEDKEKRLATGEETDDAPNHGKDAVAEAFGRRGGEARAKSLSAEQRSEIARKAAQSRWKY
jgi:hypothetical protein